MNDIKEQVKTILNMKMGEVAFFKTQWETLRVSKIPGGWIYSESNASVFVPESPDQALAREIDAVNKKIKS